MAQFNHKGHEILDKTPVAQPLGFKRPLPVADLVRKMVVRELSRAATKSGMESFQEADDFDVDDDPELKSKYELDADQENQKFIPEQPNTDRRKKKDPEPDPEPDPDKKKSAGGGKPPKKPKQAPASAEEPDDEVE